MNRPLHACSEASSIRRAVRRLLLPAAAASGLLGGGAQPALATEWQVPAAPLAHPGGARVAAEAYLREAESSLALGGVELVVRNELALGSYRTVRFAQRHAGLPVLDTGAAVRVDAEGRVRVVVLDVARALGVEPLPSVTVDEARSLVATRSQRPASMGAGASLAVLPEAEGPGRLVWVVDVPGSRGPMRHLVDAHEGRIVLQRPLGKTALGRVYEVSSVLTPTPSDLALLELVPSTPQLLNGWGGQLAVTNYVSGSQTDGNYVVEQTLQPSAGEDFLYDPPVDPLDATDGFAQVGLYYHLTRIRDFFTSTYGLDMSAASWGLVAVANMLDGGQRFDNAFFAPQGAAAPFNYPNMIAVGQGTDFDFAQDSDVFLHEFTHYVNHNAVGFSQGQFEVGEWGINTFPGSVDEGLSDYYACTINGDAVLGEASLELFGSARDLTNTAKVCPDDIMGEVHMDGELIGSVSWTLRTALGAAVTDQLVWGSLSLLGTGSSLGDYATGLVQTANDLVSQGTLTAADVTTVENALAARGLDDCGHELAVSPTEPRQTTMFGLGVMAEAMGMTCEQFVNFGVRGQSLFHFVATPAPTDAGVRFQVDLEVVGSGNLSWSIFARSNEHVSFSSSGMLPEVNQYDYAVEDLTATTGELVIDASSTPPFDPTATYHMVVTHANCPVTLAAISAGPLGEGGGGGAGGGSTALPAEPVVVDEGCGCRIGAPSGDASGTGSRGGAWGWLAVLVPIGAVLRRRAARAG